MNKAKAAVSGRIAQGTAAKLFWGELRSFMADGHEGRNGPVDRFERRTRRAKARRRADRAELRRGAPGLGIPFTIHLPTRHSIPHLL